MANLWTAASDGDIDRVKVESSSTGLTANSKDDNGYTALHAAASWGHADLLRTLVSEYAGDINIADNDGDTPLFTVESIDMCKLVLELGGDPTLVDNDGLSAAKFLLEDHEDIARYLAQLTGEELPAVASTSSIPIDADDSHDMSDTSGLDMTTAQRILDGNAARNADLSNLDPASREAAIQTNQRAGNLLAQVQEILLEADRTGEDPEARIRAVVDEAVRGTMQAGRAMAEMEVEQEQAREHALTQNGDGEEIVGKRQRTDDQPER
ncbi:ankyrin [Cystobasidium minutum MCA 4210]|uniref:ankyrin n=1 Tax=Cystobasidium minutum MCA 4210 TaxID=1397322 RepID=UPI0034CE791D|eukprot:jgi/Rhomi1/146202/e_gw1.6.320.1